MLSFGATCYPAAAIALQAGHRSSSSSYGLNSSAALGLTRRASAPKFCSDGHGQLSSGFPCRVARTLIVFTADAKVTIEKWVLQPIGDGDCSHLDEAVPLPEAFELTTDAATVGRVSEKADIVLPIATVSGLHARLERKGGTLFVTDLDSTNGTYINDRKIRPGAVTPVPPGSRVTFGDDHLAAFKFTKVEEKPEEQSA